MMTIHVNVSAVQYVRFLIERHDKFSTINEHLYCAKKVCCFLSGNSAAFKEGDYARYEAWLSNICGHIWESQKTQRHQAEEPELNVEAIDVFKLQEAVEAHAKACLAEDPLVMTYKTCCALR
jgi:hypothetical protein